MIPQTSSAKRQFGASICVVAPAPMRMYSPIFVTIAALTIAMFRRFIVKDAISARTVLPGPKVGRSLCSWTRRDYSLPARPYLFSRLPTLECHRNHTKGTLLTDRIHQIRYQSSGRRTDYQYFETY